MIVKFEIDKSKNSYGGRERERRLIVMMMMKQIDDDDWLDATRKVLLVCVRKLMEFNPSFNDGDGDGQPIVIERLIKRIEWDKEKTGRKLNH